LYIIITLIFALSCEIPLLINEVLGIVKGTGSFSFDFVIRVVGTLVQTAFFVIISMFFKFHVELVLSNSSTLDNL
jgi:hypothetical protein